MRAVSGGGGGTGDAQAGSPVVDAPNFDAPADGREEHTPAFYRSLVTNSTDLVVVLDATGAVLYVSPSSRRVLGHTPDELGPTLRTDLFHPDDATVIAGAIAAGVGTPGLTGPTVGRIRHADGSWRHMEAYFTNLLDDPDVAAIVCNMRDITDRYEVESRFRLLAENSSDLISTHDLSGRATFVSPAARELLGREPEDLLGACPWDVAHPDDVEALRGMLDAAVRGRTVTGAFRILAPDGGLHWFESVLRPVTDPVTGAVTGVQSATRDITAAKHDQAAIAESEARFRGLFASAPAGVLLCTADATVLEANAVACEMVGASPADLVGACFYDFVHPQDGERVRNLGPLPDQVSMYRLEMRFRAPDSTWRWALASLSLHRRGARDERQYLLHLQDIDDLKQAERALEHAATHDPVTGLLTRPAFTEAVDGLLACPARDADGTLAVVLVSVAGHQLVTDTYGHVVADEVLAQAGGRLVALAEPLGGAVGRLDGATFVLGVPTDDAGDVAQAALDLLHEPLPVAGHTVNLTAVAGVATTSETDARSAAELLAHADHALFEARHRPSGGWVGATTRTVESARLRQQVESELRDSLVEDDFVVLYQPVLTVGDARVVGAEAVLRWDHPRHGLLLPSVFLDVAEACGVSEHLGELMLERACAAAATWPGGTAVAVPVTGRQLARVHATVTAALTRYGLDPSRLALEIPETVLAAAAPAVLTDLAALRRAGVRVCVTGYGTGPGTLARLKDLPAQAVKLGANFVERCATDPVDGAVVAAAVTLAHATGRLVTADGVRTREQLAFLAEVGCDRVQGPLLSTPTTAAGIAQAIGDTGPVTPWPVAQHGRS